MKFRTILALALTLSMASSLLAQDDPTNRRYVKLSRTSTAPFSDGVLVGNTYYLAGRLGIDPKTSEVPKDVEQEARLMLDGVKAALADVGLSMDHLVSVQVFCSDLTQYDAFNKVYRTYFGDNFPARAFIGSGPLLRGARFEMQGIAVR
ncbi:MAG: Rid family hydrolase [Bacteroidota bacterium]